MTLTLHPGAILDVRPIEPGDRERLAAAFAGLSDETRYRRFLGPKPALSSAELDAFTQLDHINRDALAAFERATGRLVAVARYAVHHDARDAADVAIVVADEWQGRGLGTTLGRAIVRRAAASGVARLTGVTLAENARSRALLRRLGFRSHGRDGAVLEFSCDLGAGRCRVARAHAG